MLWHNFYVKHHNINTSVSSHKVTITLLDSDAYGHRNRKVKQWLSAKYLTAQQEFQVLYDWFTFLRLISNKFYCHSVGAAGDGIIINDTPVQNIGIVCDAACMRFFLLICPPCSNSSPSLIQTFISVMNDWCIKKRVYFRIEEYCSVLTSHCMLHAD